MDQEVSNLVIFIGRFHPLIVHLPVGILLFAGLMELLARVTKQERFRILLPFTLLTGVLSAACACIVGYMLSLSGDYNGNIFDLHFWFGIATTVVAFMAYLLSIGKFQSFIKGSVPYTISIIAVVILLSLTGHYGGSLTHGEDYLMAYAPFSEKEKEIDKPKDIANSVVFQHVVKPILDDKCISCHRSGKKKGELSMQDYENLIRGGKNGPVILAGNSKQSELVRRVTIEKSDKEFMPPEGKTPLSNEEIALLEFWINTVKASSKATISEVNVSEEIMGIIEERFDFQENTNSLATGEKVNESDIEALILAGFNIREMGFDSNIYDIDLPKRALVEGTSNELSVKLKLLQPIKNNIKKLSLDGLNVTDDHIQYINEFKELEQLELDRNPLTTTGLKTIKGLNNLISINLFGTNIDSEVFTVLNNMPQLKHVYVWNTKVKQQDIDFFKENYKDSPLTIVLDN
ncbi:putative membrane protein [Galbibacter orientalis DSM 19592]|uniref:Putative membrane protein n=1 Tax=Galbibacter orientalis DSM 19592 TaxID=926559 RepID=I3CAU9_9FLAO|nr:c-type cytochrome domain-containing protein [Galbibacter orientalis]EIJ40742.1 putative membrane protein [Galbibacter orientalis DSM 19592]